MHQTSIYRGFPRSAAILKGSLFGGAAIGALLIGSAAFAQSENTEVVVVTGYRASLAGALNVKRMSNTMVDAINAEDIAKFPDANLAESLQRLPGIAVDRDNGEGRQITVRGLGSDFTRVTLNGLEALATAGNTGSDTSPNRSRGFDFNTFASELFSSLKAEKSSSAEIDDGSLGATVELQTAHPFDNGGERRFVLSAQNAWYETGKPFNPRIAAVASDTFFGGRIGVLGSFAWNTRSQETDAYQSNAGGGDYTYRNSTVKTAVLPNNTSITSRSGFAAPTGTSCTGLDGVIPNRNVTSIPYCDALRGSDAATYALVQTPRGWTLNDTDSTTRTASVVSAPGSIVRIPNAAQLNHQDLYQSRLGATASIQWQANDDTVFTLDGLFSSFYQDSVQNTISAVGLNRNNTINGLAAGTTADNNMDFCTPNATATATRDELSCGTVAVANSTARGGTTAVPVPIYNYAHNMDPFLYYSTVGSPGYNAGDPLGLRKVISFIGRPSTKLVGATVQDGRATYLKLDNVDFRSGADQSYYTTQFEQLSLKATHNFSDRFRVAAVIGMSESRNKQVGLLAELNRMDSGTGSGDGYYVFDATAGGNMPSLAYGFDVADPTKWTFVKGFSALRHYEFTTINKYRQAKLDMVYDINDQFTLKAGFEGRIYDFSTIRYRRNTTDTLNPSFEELGVTTAQMTKVVSFGNGIQLPAGTPTAFLAPDLAAYEAASHFNCNCVNDYGDWRMTNKVIAGSTGNSGGTFGVAEHDKGYYGQLDFQNILIFGRELRGNIGLRFATTEIEANGFTVNASPISDHHSYNNVLPSANFVYMLSDDMLIRASAAKVMARPRMEWMAPSVSTNPSVPTGVGATTGGKLAIGNPHLDPYRANTIDVGWEWYFDKDSVISVAGFAKYIQTVPQQVLTSGPLTNFLSAEAITAMAGEYTGAQNTYILTPDASWDVTTYTNAPGGTIKGVEITFQKTMSFLPAPFDGLGVNANYTHLQTNLHYIVNTAPLLTGDGPWIGASPDAWNLTVYYDGKDWNGQAWEARLSGAYRSGYVSQYPVQSGSCDPGFCDTPIINDFINSRGTFNLDASLTWDYTDWLEFTLDALNLTNQPDRRWAYESSPAVTRYQSTGRQVFAGVRFKY